MKSFLSSNNYLVKGMILAVLFMLVFQPEKGYAKIYKYRDDKGQMHFTDDASTIPWKYREQIVVKKYRGTASPNSGIPGLGGAGQKAKNGGEGEKDGKQETLTDKDKALFHKAVPILHAGVALANRYKNSQPNFSNARGLIDALQKALPQRKNLAKALEGTKVPVLKNLLTYLKGSVAADENTKSIGAGLKKVIVGLFNRVQKEGKQQQDLLKKMEEAWDENEKKQAQAKKEGKNNAGTTGATSKKEETGKSGGTKKKKPADGIAGM